MKGVTFPVVGSTVTIRELLFCPLCVWVAWFESVANRRPPARPFSKATSTAGPCGRSVFVPPVSLVASVG